MLERESKLSNVKTLKRIIKDSLNFQLPFHMRHYSVVWNRSISVPLAMAIARSSRLWLLLNSRHFNKGSASLNLKQSGGAPLEVSVETLRFTTPLIENYEFRTLMKSYIHQFT